MIREIEKLVHNIKITNKRRPRFASDNLNMELAGVQLTTYDITFYTVAGIYTIPIRDIRKVTTNKHDKITKIKTNLMTYRIIF